MVDDTTIPGTSELLWPVLRAAGDLGGSASRAELLEHVRGVADLTDEQIQVASESTGESKVLTRAKWALQWLKAIGAFDRSESGVYTMTPDGSAYLGMDRATAVADLKRAYRDARRQAARKAAAKRRTNQKRSGQNGREDGPHDKESGPVPDDEWRATLLETLKNLDPSAFERLAKRLLREAGFQKVDVVGRVGDGGVDGIGLYKMALVSFPIYFQCKRYAGSVGASAVRDFRGAMAGRTDKGLIITTGTFTPAARAEATKDGAPPIDLIDGDELCDLILKYELGVEVTERRVREVTVNEGFFTTL